MLYLHEIIDIVGTGQEPYLDTVGERARHSEQEGISRLAGSWKVVGSTNRWPRVVNLWEMDGWLQWARSLERQFLPEKKDPELAPWWARATEWRSGGFDRILEPTTYSPTRSELENEGLRAWVFFHSLLRLRPGRRSVFLELVGRELRPILEEQGIRLFGAYSSVMRSDEAIVLWAAPDFEKACGFYETRRENARLREWVGRAGTLWERYEVMWLVPSRHCFFYPGT